MEQAKRLAVDHSVEGYTLTTADDAFADLRPFLSRHKVYHFRPTPRLNSPFGRLNQAIRLLDLYRLENVYRKMASDIDEAGYDVLLAHPCQVEQAPGVIYFVNRTPTVYYCHEPLRFLYEQPPPRPYYGNESKWRRTCDRFDPLPDLYHSKLRHRDTRNIKASRMVLVNSNFTRKAVQRIYGVEAHVSYHGVDLQIFRPLAPGKKHRVLSVGSLTPLKAHDFLIEAISRIPSGRRPALTIISNFEDPAERDYLETIAKNHAVALQLWTNVDDNRLVEMYNQAVITVYAPIGEPFGLVPLESMACGTPLVSVREGGVSESMIHGETGVLTDRDPVQFSKAILQLLDNPGLAAEYGKRGRKHMLESWTWERAVRSLEKRLKLTAGLSHNG
jgi:glycosyltransferase involved in cell wall biosynthesis